MFWFILFLICLQFRGIHCHQVGVLNKETICWRVVPRFVNSNVGYVPPPTLQRDSTYLISTEGWETRHHFWKILGQLLFPYCSNVCTTAADKAKTNIPIGIWCAKSRTLMCDEKDFSSSLTFSLYSATLGGVLSYKEEWERNSLLDIWVQNVIYWFMKVWLNWPFAI